MGGIVTIADLRADKICVAGAKTWFKRYGLDFAGFLRNGVDEDVLLATGDPLALRAVESARRRRVDQK